MHRAILHLWLLATGHSRYLRQWGPNCFLGREEKKKKEVGERGENAVEKKKTQKKTPGCKRAGLPGLNCFFFFVFFSRETQKLA